MTNRLNITLAYLHMSSLTKDSETEPSGRKVCPSLETLMFSVPEERLHELKQKSQVKTPKKQYSLFTHLLYRSLGYSEVVEYF